MTIQKVLDKRKNYTIYFDHNNKEFSIKIDDNYRDILGTLKAADEAIEFWESCGYVYKE